MNGWLEVLGLCLLVCFVSVTQAAETDRLLDSKDTTLFNFNQQQSQDELLEPDLAFIPAITAVNNNTLVVRWAIAKGCYLYRNKFQLSIVDADSIRITDLDIPAGIPKEDEFFGRQEIFYKYAMVTAHLQGKWPERGELNIKLTYQGCAEIGVCYPPISQIIPVTLTTHASPEGNAVEVK